MVSGVRFQVSGFEEKYSRSVPTFQELTPDT
jgi:hypothetical protein